MSGQRRHSGKRTSDEILRDARKEVSDILKKARKAPTGNQPNTPNVAAQSQNTSFSGCLFITGILFLAVFLGAMTSQPFQHKLLRYLKALIGQSEPVSYVNPLTEKSKPAATNSSQIEPKQPGKTIAMEQVFEAYSRMGNELFASRIITNASTAKPGYVLTPGEAPHYGRGGLIGVILRDVRKGDRLEVTIVGDRFIKESSESIVIENDARSVIVQPPVIYDYEAIHKINQTTSCNLTFKVRRRGETDFKSITSTWQIHQINDCPMTLEVVTLQADGSFRQSSSKDFRSITGYVNENHPWIDALLLEAKETRICSEFVGYQQGAEQVWPQIAAIWQALENRGLGYSSIATTTTSTRHQFQHVRFIEDSLTNKQSNCIDGSVLLASILRKIGLNVGIMLVPGHAYLTVRDSDNKNFLYAIETTLLGKADLNTAVRTATVDEDFALSKLVNNPQKYSGEDFRYIDITKIRDSGSQPIPYEGPGHPPSTPLTNRQEQVGTPEQIARQQRIILAQKIRQHVSRLIDSVDADRGGNPSNINNPGFQLEAYTLFSEIRDCQAAFNRLRSIPTLTPVGIPSSDQRLADRYSKHVSTLRSITLDSSDRINKASILQAAELADALYGIACLPLEY
jgi:hypothetical protein